MQLGAASFSQSPLGTEEFELELEFCERERIVNSAKSSEAKATDNDL